VELGALGLHRITFETFESNVLFVLRYMIDAGIVGGGWVSAPAGRYQIGGQNGRPKLSTCQLDLHMNYRCVQVDSLLRKWHLFAILCSVCVHDCSQ
jgi:DNA polymerase elongation subunit (family B)